MSARKARIAPTPSGYLHEGNLANFLLNQRLAGPDGQLLLRIDDLDRGRYRRAYVTDIFRVLRSAGIRPTEGPQDTADFEGAWTQVQSLDRYGTTLETLRKHPLVFACPCTRRELADGQHAHRCLAGKIDLDTPGVAWRVNTRELDGVDVTDLRNATPFHVAPHVVIPDFVIRNKAGFPSYQLACTSDDLHFGITHVARGVDLLPSTAAQCILSDLLEFPPLQSRIRFLHHELITDRDGAKLSKSAGAKSSPMDLDEALLVRLRQLVDGWLPKNFD